MAGDHVQSWDAHTIRDFVCRAGSGAAAGAIAATFVCPLDVIKTRLQVHGLPSGHKVHNKDRRFEGDVSRSFTNNTSFASKLGYDNNQLTIGANMVAAAGAGAATAIATNPLWVVKTRLQTQGMRQDVIPYKSILSALTRIAHEEGLRGLYSGVIPSLAGISHVAIQFPVYEKIKCYMAKRQNTTIDKLSAGSVAIASSISKVIASVSTYPHEVVCSLLQEQGQARNKEVQYAGVIASVKKVFQREGLLGFYRGCATNLLRTTPSAIITFTSYEMIYRFLQRVIPPPNKNHSQDYFKPDNHVHPQQGNEGMVKENTIPGLGQSQKPIK